MEVASQERLDQLMRSNLGDQSTAIQELIDSYPKAKTVADAKKIELLIDQYLRGDVSVLNDPSKAHILQNAMSNAYAADAAAKEVQQNMVSWVHETTSKAESKKPTGDELEREKMRGMKMMEAALTDARAGKDMKLQWLDWQLQYGEKETIAVAGRPERIKTAEGGARMLIRPEVLNIMGRRVVLNPGVREVPKVVAQYYREAVQSRQEAQARESVLSQLGHIGQLEAGYSRVDKEYGTAHQPIVKY